MEIFSGHDLGPFTFTCIALGASITSGLGAHLLAGLARRAGLVSTHRRDRFSARRVALSGGLGLMLGVCACGILFRSSLDPAWIVAAVGFFVVGLVDDRFAPRPLFKFTLQGAVALVAALSLAPSAAFVGLLFLLFLLLVNASNYLDNMDGLLAGVALTQAVALLFFRTEVGPGATMLVWALPGVLFLTLPPARLYLGDSGSHLVGALLALDASTLLLGPEGVRTHYLLPLGVLFAVPLADVATVTLSRLRRKRPLFRGGTDHLSHRLVRLGFPVPRAVLVLVLASAVCGLASLLLLFA